MDVLKTSNLQEINHLLYRSRMPFVEHFQFFLELSNCQTWILAIWRKKVTDAGNLAKKVTDAGNLAIFKTPISYCQYVKFSL